MEEVVIQVNAPASWDLGRVNPLLEAELFRVMQERGATSMTNRLTCGGRLVDDAPDQYVWTATYQIG